MHAGTSINTSTYGVWPWTGRGDGCEHPDDPSTIGGPHFVERSFCFVDLCDFTEYCDTWGPVRATEELDRFRRIVRETTGRRGVRVAKWLGDGAMLVALSPGPAVSSAVEIVGRAKGADGLSARGGVAAGAVLLHDGDDHVGRAVNIAARLCDYADRDTVLITTGVATEAPHWIQVGVGTEITMKGIAAPLHTHTAIANSNVNFTGNQNSRFVF